MNKLGWGSDFPVGPDGPVCIIKIQRRDQVSKLDVGLPEGIDRPDVAPVGLRLGIALHAGLRERMRHRLAVPNDIRDDVLAKVAVRFWVSRIALQGVDEERGLEDVDPHARQRRVGFTRHGRRIGRLLQKADDLITGIHMHHAQRCRLQPGHLDTADRYIRAGCGMLLKHDFVVHLVDVIARQDDHVFGIGAGNDVDVLIHRVRGSQVPLRFRKTLAGRQDVEALIALGPEKIPTALQVPDQGMGLVLSRDTDVAYARIESVR